MREVLALISHHGYSFVVLAVFLEAIGMPVPAALALLAAGAASALGILRPGMVLLTAIPAMMLGDTLLFVLGRWTGWTLLGLLCRIAANPESCILRSAESFYKRGRITLVIAKFVPGINTMAPPLAGSMNMRPGQFLWLDFLGASLYVVAYCGLGFLFSGFVEIIARGFHAVGRGTEWLLIAAVGVYIAYYARLYWKQRKFRVVPRIPVQELARKLAGEDVSNLLIVDVRSHGYYDSGASRIRGSIRLEPNNLQSAIKDLSKGKEIYLYCT